MVPGKPARRKQGSQACDGQVLHQAMLQLMTKSHNTDCHSKQAANESQQCCGYLSARRKEGAGMSGGHKAIKFCLLGAL